MSIRLTLLNAIDIVYSIQLMTGTAGTTHRNRVCPLKARYVRRPGNSKNDYMMPSDSALPLVHYDHMTSQQFLLFP